MRGQSERHQGREIKAVGESERERDRKERGGGRGRTAVFPWDRLSFCSLMIPCRLTTTSQSQRNRWPFELSINSILL